MKLNLKIWFLKQNEKHCFFKKIYFVLNEIKNIFRMQLIIIEFKTDNIFGFIDGNDSKSLTISRLPFSTAIYKAVLFKNKK